MSLPVGSAFHWKDNIYFQRLPNGDVRVWKAAFKGGPALFEMVVPENEWCSIVTATSARPAEYSTFETVKRLHSGHR